MRGGESSVLGGRCVGPAKAVDIVMAVAFDMCNAKDGGQREILLQREARLGREVFPERK